MLRWCYADAAISRIPNVWERCKFRVYRSFSMLPKFRLTPIIGVGLATRFWCTVLRARTSGGVRGVQEKVTCQ